MQRHWLPKREGAHAVGRTEAYNVPAAEANLLR